MKIQSTLISAQTDERAVIELFLSENPNPVENVEFLRVKLPIHSAPAPRVEELQLVVLRRTREIIDGQIQRLQSLLRQHHVNIA